MYVYLITIILEGLQVGNNKVHTIEFFWRNLIYATIRQQKILGVSFVNLRFSRCPELLKQKSRSELIKK